MKKNPARAGFFFMSYGMFFFQFVSVCSRTMSYGFTLEASLQWTVDLTTMESLPFMTTFDMRICLVNADLQLT